jgi:hypothetical protein
VANLTHGAYAQFGLRITTGGSVIDVWEFGSVSGTTNAQAVPVASLANNTSIIGSINYLVA